MRVVGMVAGFVLTMVLARELGPEGVGEYGYAVMLLALVCVPVSNGWSTVLLRATVRARGGLGSFGEVGGLLRLGPRMALGLTILVALGPGLFFMGPLGQERFSLSALVLLSGVVFLDQLSALRLSVLRGLDHPVLGQLPEMFLRPVVLLCCFLFLTWFSPNAPSVFDAFLALIAAATISTLFGGAILWWLAPSVLWSAPNETKLRIWTHSAAVLAGNAGLVLLTAQIDFIALGMLGTTEDLGHYRVAMQIGLLSGFVYTSLNMIAMQRFAQMLSSGAQDELQRMATFLARLAFFGSLPLPVLFWFWGETILSALFGPGFEASLPPLLWLLGLQVFNASAGFAHSLLVMAGRERRVLPLTTLCAGINAGFCILLIPRFGPEGAAISSFIAIGLWNILLAANALVHRGVDTSILGVLRIAAHTQRDRE